MTTKDRELAHGKPAGAQKGAGVGREFVKSAPVGFDRQQVLSLTQKQNPLSRRLAAFSP
jgi:hypothetical protein